jgi:hypothetical protein
MHSHSVLLRCTEINYIINSQSSAVRVVCFFYDRSMAEKILKKVTSIHFSHTAKILLNTSVCKLLLCGRGFQAELIRPVFILHKFIGVHYLSSFIC